MEFFDNFKIEIENPAGSYKSFNIKDDPVWKEYPLEGVTYPVDYGYLEGFQGEDGAELDVFVGSGNLNGYIKVWRLDVPEETKFFKNLTPEELAKVLEVFKPVLLSHEIISDEEKFLVELTKFRV